MSVETPPTAAWALAHARSYLAGEQDTWKFHEALVELLDYYRTLPLLEDDLVYEFVAQTWVIANRVLREMDRSEDLRAILEEFIPDLEESEKRT